MYQRHKLAALIEINPRAAIRQIVKAYIEAKASMKDAAVVLGVAESTLWRWVDRLEMRDALVATKRKAKREGWFHDKLTHGGRPRKKVA